MKDDPEKALILSASRTKDLVHRCPDLLADILFGKAPCRWGPHGPFGRVNPEALHSVILWTKDPGNLLVQAHLRESLLELKERFNVLISLEITATGLGGSFMEPGIPLWPNVRQDLKDLLAEGWINPAAVIYRYDPFLSVRTPGGSIFSNASIEMFRVVCAAFLDLGVKRVTTSRADAVHYPKVAQRVQKLGLEWIHIGDQEAFNLCGQMGDFCRSRGANFSVCCDPILPGLTDNWGCIDSRWLNKIKGDEYPKATEIPHNQIGKQRPTCQCTYSRDIGYSTGSATCYSGGFGCLYCYSQGNAQAPQSDWIMQEIAEFDQDPDSYWRKLGL